MCACVRACVCVCVCVCTCACTRLNTVRGVRVCACERERDCCVGFFRAKIVYELYVRGRPYACVYVLVFRGACRSPAYLEKCYRRLYQTIM